MRRIVITLLALALVATAACADQWRDVDVEDLIEDLPGEDRYPDADAVFGMIQEIIEVASDGSSETRRNLLIKVLSLAGREKYSNQTFTYNSDVSSITLVKGETTRKTGRVIEVEEDAINDVTPSFLEDAKIYANVLEKVISFPVVGAGSTMELQLIERKDAAEDGSFSGVEFFGGEDPFLHHEIILEYPKDVAIHAVESNGLLGLAKLKRKEKSGRITWTAENIEPLVPEDNMPPRDELLPRVLYSSYESWWDAAAYFAGEFYPHVQTEGEIAELAQRVSSVSETDDGRMYAIFDEVATGVRNVHLRLGLGGYEPNDASTVLANKYADTRDKAVLLVSMLRAAGFEAYPALVKARRGTFFEAVPTLRQFDRLLVAVPGGERYRFLDPLLDDVHLGYLRWGRGNTALLVKDDGDAEFVRIPPFEPMENSSEKLLTVALADDGSANVFISSSLRGYFDRKARRALKDATPSEADQVFESAANALSPGATVVRHDHTDLKNLIQPASVQQSIEAPDFAIRQGEMLITRIPEFPFDFAVFDARPTLSDRRLPFDLPCEASDLYNCKIIIPTTLEVVRIPDSVTIETPAADFRLTCEWNYDARTVFWTQEIIIKEKTIAVEDYAEFKEAYDTITSPKSRLVLFKYAPPGLGRKQD